MSSDPFYKTIEHTADIGIEVEAPDGEGVFARCALAMFDMMFGIESIGHSGPAEWCYLASYIIILTCASLIWWAIRPKTDIYRDRDAHR